MADQGNEGLLSPFLRQRRIQAVRPFINGRILDVGCGSGELSRLAAPGSYVGYDIDSESLSAARRKFPQHSFTGKAPPEGESFDTVVSLAVIEHDPDPVGFLRRWSRYLKNTDSRFVLTTPSPKIEVIHAFGSRIGLFSRHGYEEHEQLLEQKRLESISESAALTVLCFRKFLVGMNQLLVLSRA